MKKKRSLKNIQVKTFLITPKTDTNININSENILKQLVDLHSNKTRIEHSKRHARSRDLERICEIELKGVQDKIDELVRQRHS